MSTAASNGQKINYEVIGEGTPLLLTHGLGTPMIFWPDEFCNLLVGKGFQVIRYDNRDIGLSSHTAGTAPTRRQVVASLLRPSKVAPYRLSDMAADSVGLLDALGIERAHIVGASMGGMISQQIAIDHPQRALSLCSIMSNTGDRRHGRPSLKLMWKARRTLMGAPPANAAERAARTVDNFRAFSGPHFDEQTCARLAALAAAQSDDTLGTTFQMLAISASESRNDALSQLSLPTLVIHGMLDQLVMPSGGEHTARLVPGAQLLMFNDMAHDLPRPRWEAIAEAIADNASRAAKPVVAST